MSPLEFTRRLAASGVGLAAIQLTNTAWELLFDRFDLAPSAAGRWVPETGSEVRWKMRSPA